MKIISNRTTETNTSYFIMFSYDGKRDSGHSFPCDEFGVLDLTNTNQTLVDNYNACRRGEINGRSITSHGVQSFTNTYVSPAVGQCYCGKEVVLRSFTNTCGCGKDYNMSGELLADRAQWGEETGESLSDILGAEYNYG